MHSSLRILFVAAIAVSLGIRPSPAGAWLDHALITRPALREMPSMQEKVTAETLESFAGTEAAGLEKLLAEEEAWARSNIASYPPRPDSLAFKTGGRGGFVERFVTALRLNPVTPRILFVQPIPGRSTVRNPLKWDQVSSLKVDQYGLPFDRLEPGEGIAALDVLATASDEPDYGADVGLWEDNLTPYGRAFMYGKQPFGNPSIEYASQAPFHMDFRHEPGLFLAARPELRRTYPAQRIRVFTSLSTFAFARGHRYWGYRFAGWAIHYVQDMTQPFHTTAAPGVSWIRLGWAGFLGLLGFKDAGSRIVEDVSGRHLLLERLVFKMLREEAASGSRHALLSDVLADMKPGVVFDYWDPMTVTAAESHSAASDMADALAGVISDKSRMGEVVALDSMGPFDPLPFVRGTDAAGAQRFWNMVVRLMKNAGLHSKVYLEAMVKN